MITNLVIQALGAVVGWVFGLFGSITVPDWLSTVTQYVAEAVPVLGGLHNWLPLTAIAVSITWVLSCWALAGAVRLARIVFSAVTGGGGNVSH